MKYLQIFGLGVLMAIGLTYCNPYQESKIDIGDPAAADFTITADTGMNRYILTASGSEAFLFDWDLGNGASAEGKEVNVFYPQKGDYQVSLTAFSKGGYTSTSKTITVDQDVILPCTGIVEDLTGCTSKSWVLDPAGGSLIVGPPDGSVWWQADPAVTNDRPCAFNDEFIFFEDGTFEYKTNGDVWVDEEGGAPWPTDIGLPIGCTDDSNWPAKYADWLSGTFTYLVSENPSDTSITLSGSGAHLGLYKVGDSGTISEPQPSTTYRVVSVSETKLTVQMDFSWGYWRFTFVPK